MTLSACSEFCGHDGCPTHSERPAPAQLSLTEWQRPVAAPTASEGVKRAARAGSRVDAAILAYAPRWVGREVPLWEAHAQVSLSVPCLQDTVRRRLKELAAMGLVELGEPTKTGHVLVLGVRP
jgi:hypothetical protein